MLRVTVIIVSMRLPIHMVRRIWSISMMTRVVLRWLVPMHGWLAVLHIVVHMSIWIPSMVMSPAVIIVVVVHVILKRVHAIVLVSFSFVVLLFFGR